MQNRRNLYGRWHRLGLSLALVLVQLVTLHHGQASGKATPILFRGESVDVGTVSQGMIDAGETHTCSLKGDGTVACWGDSRYGQTTPPGGTFSQISAGGFHACGVKTDNTLACWGSNFYEESIPPNGIFSQVSAGNWHTCAIRNDGTVDCWGNNDWGQLAHIPNDTFRQVSGGGQHTCGIKTDDTLVCWGSNFFGQTSSPGGTFNQISSGLFHTCGIKTDNTVACWGDNSLGQIVLPSGTFKQISAGGAHTCGIKTDDTLVCWGDSRYGQITPPSGIFSQISAGQFYTCGVKNDDTLACWGDNFYGQAPVLSVNPSFLSTGVIGTTYSQPLSLVDAVYTSPLPQVFGLVAGDLPPGLTLSASGLLSGVPTSGGTFTFTVYGEDDNGFTATQNYTLTISGPDTTPPVITPTVSGTLGNNDWYTSNVSVSWSVVDNESTVTMQVGCDPQSVATDTTGITFTCQATSAGGTAAQSVTIKRDATAPVLSPTVSPNPVFLNGTATATPGASDTTSGLATASCWIVSTINVGNFHVPCTATDNAGNVADASTSYMVTYQFLGFLSPLPQDSYRPGATIRVRFRLGDASGTPIAEAAAQGLVAACRVKVGLDSAAGCASYDARTDLFQFDVKVSKSTSVGTHQIVMEARASDNTVVNTATTAVVIR